MYLAMAAGKAIITQEAYGTPGTPAIPALVVPPTADALKAAILDLASNRDERARLEQAAVTYYREYLGENAIARSWRSLLEETRTRRPGLAVSSWAEVFANLRLAIPDRKSVVEGQGVSVSVDLGGRGLI